MFLLGFQYRCPQLSGDLSNGVLCSRDRAFRIRRFYGGKGLKHWGFLELGEAENLQNVGQAVIDFQFAFEGGHQHVGTAGDPDFGLHSVFAGAGKLLIGVTDMS